MKLLSLIVFAFCALASPYPGVRTSIGLAPMNKLLKASLPSILEEIRQTVISPITLSTRLLLIPLKVQISNFEFVSLSLDIVNSNFMVNNQTNQLYLTLANFNMFMKADYKYLHYGISGDFNITLINSTVILPFQLGVDRNGVVTSEALPLIGDLSSLNIQITPNGFISTSFMVLSNMWPFKKYTNEAVVRVFDSVSTLFNPKLQSFFGSIKFTDQIGNLPIAADYHFYSIQLNPNSISSVLNGTFYLIYKTGAVSPVVPPSYLPDFVSTSSVRIQLTDYYFDSMMWALYASNTLNVYISSTEVPVTFPYTFTTTGLNKLIPGLVSTYGPNLPVDLQCSVYKIPIVNIQDAVEVTVGTSCNFIVLVSSSIKVTAVTLLAEFDTNFLATISNQNEGIYIIGSLDNTNTEFTNFSIINSQVGIFSTDGLAKAINWYTYYVILKANSVLQDQGIRLPLPEGITVTKTTFNLYPGAVEIGFEPIFS